jgi:eukaryotic-like serine/threonine-protein kinase
LTAEVWAEVDKVLTAALALDEDERAAYIAECCAGQPAIRAEVESLLASHLRAKDFMEGSGPAEDGSGGTVRVGSLIGSHAGPYRLVREIGRGGMGIVFLGERDDGHFRKQVAIKLISAGAAGPDILQRFRGERQILAKLDHPNIARLLDGGLAQNGPTDTSMPYIVMEYVDGVPIHQYCSARQLSLKLKVALFRSVCSAVHFAHQNLVVHRDIKPGNILVTPDGVPKLLDFGVAKILGEAEGSSQETATAPLLRAMTLDYASPEQLRGLPITTASDIYSLGVLLYELLVGEKPYVLTAKTLDEVLRLVCVEEPFHPGAVNRELMGDLDAIVLKAMEKVPAHRYASAEEFSTDLGRFLAGQPVAARHASLRYVVGKYLARHRSRAAVLAAGIILLLAGAGAIAWEARVANQERAKAQRRFDDLRKLANAMVFEVNESLEKLPGTTEARKVMVTKGLEYLDALAKEAEGDPGLQREVGAAYIRLGDIQGNRSLANLGDSQGALASYEKARGILISALARDPRDIDARLSLVDAYRKLSSAYGAARNSGESLRTAREAVAAAEVAATVNPTNERVRRSLGSAYFAFAMALKDGDSAIETWQKCLDIYLSLLKNKPDADQELRNVALVHKYMIGQFQNRLMLDKALDHARQAEEMDSKRLEARPSNLTAQLDLALDFVATADCYKVIGDSKMALDRYRRSLDIRRKLADADPLDSRLQGRLLYAELLLANTLLKRGDVPEALELYQAAARIGKVQSARNSADIGVRSSFAYVEEGLGQAWDRIGHKSEACASFRSALAIHEDLVHRGVDTEDERIAAAAWKTRIASCGTNQ